MNFLIVGAGSIGCYVGGRLAAAGQRVVLVGRPAILEPLSGLGLTVSDLDGYEARLAADQLLLTTTVAQGWQMLNPTGANSQPTMVLLCVKGGATSTAAAELGACCPAGTMVVSLQNGVDNIARIAKAAPELQSAAGMVPYNVVMPAPGRVHRATEGSIHLEGNATTQTIAKVFNASGLATVVSPDIRSVQWGKLLLNLNNPVNALSDLPLVVQLGNRNYRRVLAALQSEALGVLAAAGIRPAKVSKVAPGVLPTILRLPDWLFSRIASGMLRMDASARSSMWEDLRRGRTTEIDDLCGAIVRLGMAHGIATPANARMCQLIADYQAGKSWTGAALLAAIR